MSTPTTTGRAKVLCVDDEPNVLDGLALHLRRRYEVLTAESGAEALALIEREGTPAAVMSDMRMPGMDGAAFLSKVRQMSPDTVRLLLTGQADLDSAIAAVNEGQIFRFLTKPCPPPALLAAVGAAVEQHRLVTSERVLLEQTLRGSIRTLADVLSVTNPLLFGRATRIQAHVAALAEQLQMRDRWQVEVAAMLSQLGYVALPPDVAQKVYYAKPLTEKEQAMLQRVPEVNEQLLGHIPRLEVVRAILNRSARSGQPRPDAADPDERLVQRGVHLLRVAMDFDALESEGTPPALAVDRMRVNADRYDEEVLNAMAAVAGTNRLGANVTQMPTTKLRVGMVLAEDVVLETGSLLVARGYTITAGFLERVRNFRPGTVKEHVLVFVPAERATA
ncbi:MAG: response regulator [Vicinamibacterales bacterium]